MMVKVGSKAFCARHLFNKLMLLVFLATWNSASSEGIEGLKFDL